MMLEDLDSDGVEACCGERMMNEDDIQMCQSCGRMIIKEDMD